MDDNRPGADFLADQFEKDLKAVMNTPAGRNVMSEILEFSGVNRSPFHPSGQQMALNVGRQEVGRFLMALLMTHTRDLYFKMQVEKIAVEEDAKARAQGGGKAKKQGAQS